MVAWSAYAEFYEDGTGRVRAWEGVSSSSTLALYDSEFAYVVDGDRIELTATTGDCGAGVIGRYRWRSVGASAFRITPSGDSCASRRDALRNEEWYWLGDTPVVEIDPDGDPVTIDSPIGPMAWRVVPGQRYAWRGPRPGEFSESYRPIVAIDGGFVAVVAEQAEGVADRALVFSPDGVNWQSIPSPPSSVGWIAADREHLYVAPATPADTVYVTADRGDTWAALEVADPPASVRGLYAGPAGVVLTGPGSPLWLLDGGSFDRVATAPERFARILVLETGFFAWSVDHLGGSFTMSYWRSDDGRTWTEATEVPTDIFDRDSTNWGDNVFLSRSDSTGYTSMDGGRTWSSAGMRPGEGLAVSDAGYVSVQPAIFGPTVGVVWVSSDDVDWQRVVNPWPPLWTFHPVISGDMILVPGVIDPPAGAQAYLDLVGHVVDP